MPPNRARAAAVAPSMMRAVPVFPVDKPLGPTSHDVVAQARRRLGTRKVGHAGTLDPLASGVLVLLSEASTKLSPYLTGVDKSYLAWVALGASTPTLDAEGPIEDRVEGGALDAIDVDAIEAAVPPFLALETQVPPAYSAVKRGGVKGYEAARAGDDLELEARPAGYAAIDLLALRPSDAPRATGLVRGDGGWRPVWPDAAPDAGAHADAPDGVATLPLSLPPRLAPLPVAVFALRVRSGTYIRAFARDLGAALGVPAHLAGLVRTRAGAIGLEHTTPLEELGEHPGLAPSDALPLPRIELGAEQARRVRLGQRLALALPGRVQFVDPEGHLVAVAEPTGDAAAPRMNLRRVWHAPDET